MAETLVQLILAFEAIGLDAQRKKNDSSKNGMALTPEQLRALRARRNFGRDALGKLVRKKACRDCSYTADGHLKKAQTQ